LILFTKSLEIYENLKVMEQEAKKSLKLFSSLKKPALGMQPITCLSSLTISSTPTTRISEFSPDNDRGSGGRHLGAGDVAAVGGGEAVAADSIDDPDGHQLVRGQRPRQASF